MENMITIIIGVLFIGIGISNCKGNISLLHSYHRNRVKKEDEPIMGKICGIGMLVIAFSLIAQGVLLIVDPTAFASIAMCILYAGLAIGIAFNFYAIIKYNKGLF